MEVNNSENVNNNHKNHRSSGPEKDVLARMRTLLALERNYLAEERTQLAQFRTGIALALFGPPSSAIYLPSSITLEIPFAISVIIIIFFAGITGFGIYWMLTANKRLRKIRKKKIYVRERESEILDNNEQLRILLADCMEDYSFCD